MTIPDQFTTEPNDRPAPTWEKPGLYWNPHYLAFVNRRDRHQPRTQHGAVRVVRPAVPVRPVRQFTFTCQECGDVFTKKRPRGTYLVCDPCKQRAYARAHERKKYVTVSHQPRACVVCGETFTPIRSDQVTCTDTRCRAERRRQQSAAARLTYRFRKERGVA